MSAAAEPAASRRVAPLLWGLLCIVAIVCAARSIDPSKELTHRYDPDTIDVFHAFERDPSLAFVVSWYFADGPQEVHTFRPLQYTLLRAEYVLFGWRVWPYQVVHWLLFCATVAGIVSWLRRGGAALEVALAAAILTFIWPSEQNHAVIDKICTLSEVLCGMFAVWAAWALHGWMDDGGRRWPVVYAGLLLAAFLSKEMAAGPAIAFLAALAIWPGDRRRRLRAVGVTVAVSVLWLVWFRLAEQRMIIAPEHTPHGHSFANLWERLWAFAAINFRDWLHAICRPWWQIHTQLYAGVGWEIVWTADFWRNLPLAVIWPLAVVLAARRYPKLIRLWACWNVLSYLPVLPLHDLLPWYEYLPDLLDRAFDVLAVVAVWEWWQARRPRLPADQPSE